MAEHGFEQVRQTGSPLMMPKRMANITASVPVPGSDERRMGPLLDINRQSRPQRSLGEVV